MDVEIQFQDADADGRSYLTWRPKLASVRIRNVAAGVAPNVRVELTSGSTVGGGVVVFSDTELNVGQDSLEVDLPVDGSPVDVWVAGKFQFASKSFGDVSVVAREIDNGQPTGPALGRVPVMVRVRKNGESLSNPERDRFLSAMAVLNGQGMGRFADLRDMHDADAYRQIHVNVCFLPWHRAYLLDFERELQSIDPEVSLPYWRFDEPAPRLMQPSFMGRGRTQLPVDFSNTNPLRNWSADGSFAGVARGSGVGPTTVLGIRTEEQSLKLSEGPTANFAEFSDWNYTAANEPTGLEADPHNGAHSGHDWDGSPTRPPLNSTRSSICCTPTSIASGPNGNGCQTARSGHAAIPTAPRATFPRRDCRTATTEATLSGPGTVSRARRSVRVPQTPPEVI